MSFPQNEPKKSVFPPTPIKEIKATFLSSLPRPSRPLLSCLLSSLLSCLLFASPLAFASLQSPLTGQDLDQKQAEIAPHEIVKFSFQRWNNQDRSYLILSYKNKKNWHTYWINPGDAGLPFKFEFRQGGNPVKLSPMPWPVPQRYLEAGGLTTYGHSKEYSFFFELGPDILANLSEKELHIKSSWLMCKDICIPGQAEGSLRPTSSAPISPSEIKRRFLALPRPLSFPPNLEISLSQLQSQTQDADSEQLVLHYTLKGEGPHQQNPPTKLGLLTPFRQSPFDFQREELFHNQQGELHGKTLIGHDGQYLDPPEALPKDGHFKKPYTLKFLYTPPRPSKSVPYSSFIIEKEFSSFALSPPALKLFPLPDENSKASSLPSSTSLWPSLSTLLISLFLAFLGGLLLNVMPCVLPVISLKLFGLISQRDSSPSQILRHNFFYSLGIWVSFAALAAVFSLLKWSGEQVGWGLQMQSPLFIFSIIGILFLMALNLFGLFEFVTPGGRILANISLKRGVMGDFFNGVLATVLATPCSAPFLGTALAFALSSPVPILFLIFLTVGLGLSIPFLLTAFFPSLIRFLPRPGAWMENLKKFLGLILILTLVWLGDIFLALTSSSAMNWLQIVLILTFFAFYFKKFIKSGSGSGSGSGRKWVTFFFLLPILATIYLGSQFSTPSQGQLGDGSDQQEASSLTWTPWSPEEMAKSLQRKELAFIDFTAKWCLTCQVNEKLVLKTKAFAQLARKYQLKLLLADWTRRNPQISRFLAKEKIAGIPIYFIQTPDGRLINLGETISIGEINKHLEENIDGMFDKQGKYLPKNSLEDPR